MFPNILLRIWPRQIIIMVVLSVISKFNDKMMLTLGSSLYSGRMLPLRPPAGKPAPLVCTYAATGHNSAVLSLDVTEDLMFTGSKGWSVISNFFSYLVKELFNFGI